MRLIASSAPCVGDSALLDWYSTKNGTGDLAVMSIETYERLVGKFELYSLLEQGMEDAAAGRVKPADNVFDRIESRLANEGV